MSHPQNSDQTATGILKGGFAQFNVFAVSIGEGQPEFFFLGLPGIEQGLITCDQFGF